MFHTIDITFNFTIPFIHTIMNALKTYTHYESEYDDSKLTKSPIGVRTTTDQSAFRALFLIVRSDIEVLQSLGNHFGLTLSNFGPRSDGKRTKREWTCARRNESEPQLARVYYRRSCFVNVGHLRIASHRICSRFSNGVG